MNISSTNIIPNGNETAKIACNNLMNVEKYEEDVEFLWR